MSTGQARVEPEDLRVEFRDWQKDSALQLQKLTSQVEEMRQRVEGLRELMAPFEVKFAAAVTVLTQSAMQLYMVVNNRC